MNLDHCQPSVVHPLIRAILQWFSFACADCLSNNFLSSHRIHLEYQKRRSRTFPGDDMAQSFVWRWNRTDSYLVIFRESNGRTFCSSIEIFTQTFLQHQEDQSRTFHFIGHREHVRRVILDESNNEIWSREKEWASRIYFFLGQQRSRDNICCTRNTGQCRCQSINRFAVFEHFFSCFTEMSNSLFSYTIQSSTNNEKSSIDLWMSKHSDYLIASAADALIKSAAPGGSMRRNLIP